ncbi:antitoxin family protein [Thermococcus henrietii]|uniref:antitoxin family protein n=1 Tax=Thermococcus henrietii TaxID=2016361 RepID=UPI000C06D40D|nr:antitoxin family protein [Thermococcus henrietii]
MEEVEVVYENGVFKPLKKVNLKEGTHGKVIVELGLADIIEKFSEKVEKDALKEFLEERR